MSDYFKTGLTLTVLLMAVPAPVTSAETDSMQVQEDPLKQCALCHNTDGNSTINTIPSIAGMNADYFKYTIEAYKNGSRKSDVMTQFTEKLTPDEINQMASFYADQTYQPASQSFDETLAEKGKAVHNKYCAKCHEDSGYPNQYSFGILGGQWTPYLELTIKEYLDGTRKTNTMMVTKLNRVKSEIGDEGIKQLLHYYASVKN